MPPTSTWRLMHLQQPPAGLVAAGDTHGHGSTAERRHVARRVPGSAGHDLGRVVVEDEDRRLARDARQLSVDEFVDDQVAEDGDTGLVERVDQGQETSGINHVGQAGSLRSERRRVTVGAESMKRRPSDCR